MKTTSLGGDAIRLTLSKVFTLCISTATGMLLARFRTLGEYGTYSSLLLVINLFTTLFMLGLPNSINFFLARADTDEERKHFLSVYYTVSTLLSLIIGVVLVLAIPLIEYYFHNNEIGKFFYFLAIYPWATIIFSSIDNVLIVYKKTSFLVLYKLLYSLAMLLSVLLVQIFGFGFTVYMALFIIVNSFFSVSVYCVSFRISGGITIAIDNKLIKNVLAFSIPIGVSTMVGTLNGEIDKLLIGFLKNTEELAIYTNAAKELPITIVSVSITAVLLPRIAVMLKHDKTEEAVSLWKAATVLSLYVIVFVVAVVFIYANEVITFLYSSKYLPGVKVFRVYTLNLILRCTYFGIILNSCGETKKIFICSLLTLLSNAIMNPIFYYIFGIIGPAIATFISMLIVILLQLRMTSKVTKTTFSDVFPWKNALFILLVNLSFAVLFFVIKEMLPLEQISNEVIESIVLGVIWGLLYFFIIRKHLLKNWILLNKGDVL